MLILSFIGRNSLERMKPNSQDKEQYQQIKEVKWEMVLALQKLQLFKKEKKLKACWNSLQLLRHREVAIKTTRNLWTIKEAKATQYSTHLWPIQNPKVFKATPMPVECLDQEFQKIGKLIQWMIQISIQKPQLESGHKLEVISAKRNFYQEHLTEEWIIETHSPRLTHFMSMFQSHVKSLPTLMSFIQILNSILKVSHLLTNLELTIIDSMKSKHITKKCIN